MVENVKLIIDVRNLTAPERLKKVSRELDKIASGELAQIIAGDSRLPEMAPKIIKSIGKAELIRTWQGEDGFYYALVRKTE